MNSLKTTIVCVVLLGVLYGMYQVINTPTPTGLGEEEVAFDEQPGTPLTPQTLLDEQVGSTSDADSPLAHLTSPPLRAGSTSSPSAGSGGYSSPASNGMSSGLSAPSLRQNNPTRVDRGNPSIGSSAGNSTSDRSSNPIPDERTPNLGLSPPSNQGFDNSTLPPSSGTQGQLAPPGTTPAAPSNPAAGGLPPLTASFENANVLISENRFADALFLLSAYYTDTTLQPAERTNLQTWLDALAAKVIYSSEHHLFAPYVVQPNDSIERIASQFEVPVELLQKINAERFRSGQLGTGSELKVVPGPFRAVIDIQTSTLTLWLGDMYAGNFAVDLANGSQLPAIGTYRVASRSNLGRDYISPTTNATIPKMAPANPYGQYLLDLGNGVLIHESASDPVARQNGCIGLAANDALDIYSILDRNSEVRLIR